MDNRTIRMMLRGCFLIFTMLMFSGCGLFNSDSRDEVQEQLAKWRSYNLQNYSFEFQAICFCIPEFNEWVTVTVRNDTITSVTLLSTDQPPVELQLNAWYTIEELFDRIIDVSGRAEEFDVAYNKRYGYPEFISVDIDKQIADEEFTYNSMNLVVEE